MIKTFLTQANAALVAKDYALALNCLSHARAIARTGKTQRTKIIAVHCTAAMQAILPLAVERNTYNG